MGKIILGFFYYCFVGIAALFSKVLGIDPFDRKKNPDSFWKKRESDSDNSYYRITEPPGTAGSEK